MDTLHKYTRRAGLAALAALNVVAGARAATHDNDQLRTAITALGVAFNASYLPALVPGPTGFVAGTIVYSTNLGLKYTPPVLVAPAKIAVAPNSADGCKHSFFYPRQAEEDRKDYLGLITEFPTDFGLLGRPEVFHWSTDVSVSAHLAGETLQKGNISVQAGRFDVRWDAATQLTPVLDYPPWYLLLGGLGAKDDAAKSGSQSGKVLLRELLKEVAQEGAFVAADWLLLDSTPTPTIGPPIRNTDLQPFWVFDIHPPTISTSAPLVSVEATQVGGEFLRDHLTELRNTITATDKCGREPFVFHNGPPFLPVGVESTIVWTARDDGPTSASGGVNAATAEQRVRVQDTRPPLLLPPPGKVLETTAATISTDTGRPGVFDLADVRVTVTDDAPASYPRDSRTRVTWTATDASGNQATEAQWITVKQTGTNTAPVAEGRTLNAISFEPVRIELAGSDNDLLSGRYDQLSFGISREPANGFFVAPLFPFFIQDHRVENVFGLPPIELATFLNQQCEQDRSFQPPRDFVSSPRYVTIGDTGVVYVSDNYYRCSSGSATTIPRIARFATGADGRLEFTAQMETGGIQVPSLRFDLQGRVYFIVTTGSGGSQGNLNIVSSDLSDQEVIVNVRSIPTAPGSELVRSPYAVAADDQGVVYLTDGRVVNAYDVIGTRPNRTLRFLGSLADFDDLATGGDFKDLALDTDRAVYLSDSTRHLIWKFNPSTYTGGGPSGFTRGARVGWLGACTSNLTAARACDVANQRSYGFSCTDQLCGTGPLTGSPGSAPGQFRTPRGLAMSPSDVLYVADSGNKRVQRFTRDGFFGGEAVSACPERRCFVLGDFGLPVHVTANSNHFYLLDQDRDILHVFKTTPITDVDDQTLTPRQSAFVTYQSNNNFLGDDSFQYALSDGLAGSAPATVNIAVSRSHRPPTADEGLVYTSDEDATANLVLTGLDPDIWDQDSLTFAIVQPPARGLLTGTGAMRTYTPDRDFNGDDAFSFTVSDGRFTSSPATAILRVRPINDVPVITVERAQMDVGVGYARTFQATLTDPDASDTHRLVVDFGDGTVLQQGAANSAVTLAESSPGSAVMTARRTYGAPGTFVVRFCASEGSPAPVVASCSAPGVRAVGSISARALPMADVSVAIDDSLPKTEDEAGIERSAPVMDGVPFTLGLTVSNAPPTGVAGLPAVDTQLRAKLDDRLRLIAVRTGAGSCSVSGQSIECAFGTLASGQSVSVMVDAAGDGTVFEQTTGAIASLITSITPDPSGASVGARTVSLTVDPDGDADGDGVPNRDDAFPGDPTEAMDTDRDGIGNNRDTDDDNDTMRDAWETRYGFDPLDSADAALDIDGDTLSNSDEHANGTDPLRVDSDHDAHRDDVDNCPAAFNARQFDVNDNALGDECDPLSIARAVRLADVNGNGAAEIAMLRTDGTGTAALYLRDGSTGRSVQPPRQLEAYREVNGAMALALARGQAPHAVAFLATAGDGSVIVDVMDVRGDARVGVHSYFTPEWKPVALASLNLTDETSVAVLAKGPDEIARVELRSARTGTLLTSIDAFGPGWTPSALVAIPSGNGAGARLAVLATHDSGEIAAEVLDAQSGTRVARIDFFTPEWAARDLIAVSGSANGELALLATNMDGQSAIEVRDAGSGALARTVATLEAGFTALSLARLPGELAVLASNVQGEIRVESRALATGAFVNGHGFFDASRAPRGLFIDAGAATGIAVLATDASGVLYVQLRNAGSGALVSDLEAPGTDPAPVPMPPPQPPAPPSGGGGGGGGGFGLMAMMAALVAIQIRRRRWALYERQRVVCSSLETTTAHG